MYVNIYGTCNKCGKDLTEADVGTNLVGRRLCSKCYSEELLSTSSVNFISVQHCDYCGADIPITSQSSLSVLGKRLCSNCKALERSDVLGLATLGDSAILPTVSGSIESTLSGLEIGVFDPDKVSIVDSRDEQIAKLEAKLEELEQTGQEDKEEFSALRQRFDKLEKLEKTERSQRNQRASSPSFTDICQELEYWIPRRSRRYEEAYKAELVEYLSHRFLRVREEERGGLVDILIADQHPIHLKVTPTRNEYNTLVGQIASTLKQFECVACIIVGVRSFQVYEEFVDTVYRREDPSKVSMFPKAK